MKVLWRRERRYVAIPNMEVWLRLARLAPDVPDRWSFADALDTPGRVISALSFHKIVALSLYTGKRRLSVIYVSYTGVKPNFIKHRTYYG